MLRYFISPPPQDSPGHIRRDMTDARFPIIVVITH